MKRPGRHRHFRLSRYCGKMGTGRLATRQSICDNARFCNLNIIGATTMEQLKLAVTSVDIEMSDELLGEIEAVHMRAPNVCP